MISNIDISESMLVNEHPAIIGLLLKDQTTQKNIFWATDSYSSNGDGFKFNDEITIERITGNYEGIIRPRCVKSRDEQLQRTKDKAEVFTPSWICNKQNNLIDRAWFGYNEIFNQEIDNQYGHTWIRTNGKVTFPDAKDWRDYIRDTRMEITCGEAPYLASRYDTITGDFIPLTNRIGLLDRKLRIVNENTISKDEWVNMAIISYQNILGFDWQGDNVLLSRESLFFSFIEYYRERFHEDPPTELLYNIAYIISWNVWQMDGLKYVVPMSCHDTIVSQPSLFDSTPSKSIPCKGCKNNDNLHHNGIYCNIMDWEAGHPIKFYSLRIKK